MARRHLLEKRANRESQFIKRVLLQLPRSSWFRALRAGSLGCVHLGDPAEQASCFVDALLLFIDEREGQESWLCCFSHLANQNLCYVSAKALRLRMFQIELIKFGCFPKKV